MSVVGNAADLDLIRIADGTNLFDNNVKAKSSLW